MTDEVVYHDVSTMPGAAEQAQRAPEMETQLQALGFRQVGLVEARLPALTQTQWPAVDVPKWDAGQGVITAVFSSPDKEAFAVAEEYFGEPLVSLYTLTEEGTVVESTMHPSGSQGKPPETFTAGGGRFGGVTGRLAGRLVGEPSPWLREDRPQVGYHLELVETKKVAVLWARHQERLAALRDERIGQHDQLPLYVATLLRGRQIERAEAALVGNIERRSGWLLAAMGIFVLIALPLLILLRGQTAGPTEYPPLELVGLLLFAVMILLLLAQPMLRRRAIRELGRAAQRVPARELVAEVRQRHHL